MVPNLQYLSTYSQHTKCNALLLKQIHLLHQFTVYHSDTALDNHKTTFMPNSKSEFLCGVGCPETCTLKTCFWRAKPRSEGDKNDNKQPK